ncbi:uncharacterized protein TNCV_2635291 [Trichonephila clavipes]|nr:uncharacterized protein TNCV_2635291 [Trichonephila clavipes]
MLSHQVYDHDSKRIIWCYKISQKWHLEEKGIKFVCGRPDKFERLHDIGNQIQNLLQESNYSDDAKAKLLSQLLLKHQRILNEPKPPLRVSMEESNQQMQDAPKNEADLILRDIALSVPANFQKFVSPLVEKLNTRNYSWNEYGELMRDKEIIKNTNVSDLFSYLMRNVKKGYENRKVFQCSGEV